MRRVVEDRAQAVGTSPSRVRPTAPIGRLHLLLLAAVVIAGVAPAAAQGNRDQQEQQRLFTVMQRDPENYDAAFDYVRVSERLEDYEAAIGTLERLLLYNAALTRVKFELGALYYRLGSYEMASRYFQEALASPDLDAVTRTRIETYLPSAEKARAQSRLSGFLQAGLRYQSNATFAPDAGPLLLGGQGYALGLEGRRQSDWNAFQLLGLSHDFDLQNQRGDVIETRFIGYAAQQFKYSDLSLGLGELSIGPRLAIAPEAWPGATIKPYVVGGTSWLDGGSYLSSGGAGVTLGLPVGKAITIEPLVEWRRATVNEDGVFGSLASGVASGDWFTIGTGFGVRLTDDLKLDGRGFYRRNNSRFDFQSYGQYVAEAALTFEFAPPLEIISRRWSVAPFVRYVRTDFDEANPVISSVLERRDEEWRTGVMIDAPLTASFGVSTIISYSKVNSTIPNYRTDNFSVSFGPTARF